MVNIKGQPLQINPCLNLPFQKWSDSPLREKHPLFLNRFLVFNLFHRTPLYLFMVFYLYTWFLTFCAQETCCFSWFQGPLPWGQHHQAPTSAPPRVQELGPEAALEPAECCRLSTGGARAPRAARVSATERPAVKCSAGALGNLKLLPALRCKTSFLKIWFFGWVVGVPNLKPQVESLFAGELRAAQE